MSASLVKYDEMCRAIDQAFEVDEVKDIRDKAMAFEAYAKQARNTQAERKACDIRLRAERKAGALLAEKERAQGQRSDIRTSPNGGAKSFKEQLDEHGISKRSAERWQQLAAVPEAEFEAALAAPDKPTTNGIITAAKPPRVYATNERALWVWGRLQDFEREDILAAEPSFLFNEMPAHMRADVLRLAPLVISWLKGLSNDQ